MERKSRASNGLATAREASEKLPAQPPSVSVEMAHPPYYVLISHSTLSGTSQAISFRHPTIQYHYSDDSPLSLLPQHPQEHVLVLNHDPQPSAAPPTVQSISKTLIVTRLKVEEAPGAAAAVGDHDGKNDKMFIVETCTDDSTPHEERKQPQAILAHFKYR